MQFVLANQLLIPVIATTTITIVTIITTIIIANTVICISMLQSIDKLCADLNFPLPRDEHLVVNAIRVLYFYLQSVVGVGLPEHHLVQVRTITSSISISVVVDGTQVEQLVAHLSSPELHVDELYESA